jgi:hypothetical protein
VAELSCTVFLKTAAVQKAVTDFRAAGTRPFNPDDFELAQQINDGSTSANNGERRRIG